MIDIISTLAPRGADADNLFFLDDHRPGMLRYCSVVEARRSTGSVLAPVVAVYEWQAAPLMFIADAEALGNDREALLRIRRTLAMRGDAPYLGVVGEGRLDVYGLALDNASVDASRIEVPVDEEPLTLSRLANARPGAPVGGAGWISSVVLRLLGASIDRLVSSGINRDDAISLVGRALFTRFLCDRGLLQVDGAANGDHTSLFDDAPSVAATCHWLDSTFNGDLLPVSAETVRHLSSDQCMALGDVMRRAPGGQLHLGWKERWDALDFAHIPIGVLSEAYEQHLRKYAEVRQRKQGGFYTPRPIADLMVRASFRALDRDGASDTARVLDPAAGAGVFLLAAFVELVERHWRATGVRPDTAAIRDIMYGQVRGFDVNESALRFAALGLYLLAIELDPSPEPVSKLRFRNLRGEVLHRVGDPDDDTKPHLGSLGPAIGDEHLNAYDVVIGNPPWSSGTKLPDWKSVVSLVGRITVERSPSTPPPPLPNEILDLPFVWRAMQWTRAGGQIAFALHGRSLFQQGEGMAQTRAVLFSVLNVTAVVNGVDLRKTQVWPEIDAPFCLLFAKNNVPGPADGFRFVSPKFERGLNGAGVMRVDALNAGVVTASQLASNPAILKTLYRGGRADLDVYERVLDVATKSLADYWKPQKTGWGGSSSSSATATIDLPVGPPLSGNGYQRLRPSSRHRFVDGVRAEEPGVDARYLWGLPEISVGSLDGTVVDLASLPRFALPRIHDPRPRELFEGPLLLVRKSPPVSLGRMRLGIAAGDAVFNESFYGYSTRSFRDGVSLARYLTLVLGSETAIWLALMTSGEFGVEREVVEKGTIDRLPFPPFESLSAAALGEVESLFGALVEGGDTAWSRIDEWVCSIYQLDDADRTVIEETLRYSLPYASNRSRGQVAPDVEQIETFRSELEASLAPFLLRPGTDGGVFHVPIRPGSPWRVLAICPGSPIGAPRNLTKLLAVADRLAATETTVADDGCLYVARLNQARYWTRTQARLCAERLVWDHLDALMLEREL